MSRRAVALLALMLASAPALADEAAEAEHSFRRATALRKAGRFDEALDHYFVSNRLAPNPAAVLGIAYCLRQLGRIAEAVAAYEEYLADDRPVEDLGPGGAADARRSAREALASLLSEVARLEIVTRPAGAEIYVDRVNLGSYGRTPRVISPRPPANEVVAPGAIRSHDVILSLDGYRTARRTVELAVGEQRAIAVDLEPLTGRVVIASAPEGAEVHVAGTSSAARCPAELVLPIGAHRLEIALAGHAPVEREVSVLADRTVVVEVKLEPIPPPKGRVRVLTNVASALVRADGLEIGFSPLVVELPAGARRITVEKPGHEAWEGVLDVSPRRPLAAEVTLEPLRRDSARTPWPWVLAASTGAVAAVSAVLTGVAVDRHASFSAAPTLDLRAETTAWNAAADVAWGVTLVGAVATATLFLLGEDGHPSSAATLTALSEVAP